jgi:bacteriophage N4 adsorption protein B
MMATVLSLAGFISFELALFAAVGFIIIGVDDLIVDVIWFAIHARRKIFGHMPPDRQNPFAKRDIRLAVFIPAWQESKVIGPMLSRIMRIWEPNRYVLFIGCYPNDQATINAVQSVKSRAIRLVINARPGPTTKGDCLNALWDEMCAEEVRMGMAFAAIILHDAEDQVHPEELPMYGRLIQTHAAVQIPVMPIIDQERHWVSGHYADEFAECHARDLVVREAIGASLPLAGVGCAIRRDALGILARQRGGAPFDETSLTEDYEIGLGLGEAGWPSTFCRQTERWGSIPVAVHAHFPDSFETAIRQKTRWTMGIALLGWQRLGWRGGLAEFWMRCRDRRAVFSAVLIFTAFIALLLSLMTTVASVALGKAIPTVGPVLGSLLIANAFFFVWRALVRFICVNRHYGRRQAWLSLPRMAVSSFVSVAAAWRAVRGYIAYLRGHNLVWDKTAHVFPAQTDLGSDI